MKAVIQKTDVQTVRRNLRSQPEAALKGEWSRGVVNKNSEIWHEEEKAAPRKKNNKNLQLTLTMKDEEQKLQRRERI